MYPQYPMMQMTPYGYQGINMGPNPAIFTSQPQQVQLGGAHSLGGAQMFTSGVPGAPPVFAVSTDPGTMSSYALPQGPRPMKQRGVTLKKGRSPMSFSTGGDDDGQSGGGSGSGANITVTVNKMN